MRVSWKHEHTEFSNPSFEQKVELFYEQTLGWQLHIADLLANGGATFEANGGRPSYPVDAVEHSGFAVLHICLSYFELIGSVIVASSKNTRSVTRFKAGAADVFPMHFNGSQWGERLLNRLYKGARCGLYHAGRTGRYVGLGSPPDGTALLYIPESDQAVISPERLPIALKAHLEKFRLELLNPARVALRAQFERRFDEGFG
jgi:hypothetical protein